VRIALVTPARPGSRAGNLHTAQRWAAFLRAAGHSVTVAHEWMPDRPADLLLALHARRSHASIKAFAERFPHRPLVLALTGTDIYRDIHESAQARESLRLATRFITLQREAALELSARLRRKVSVVVQSCASRRRHEPVSRGFRICVIGHLRTEKDPLRVIAALRRIPSGAGIEVVHLGAALDDALERRARAAAAADPRYRWLGGTTHSRALAWLASSHAMLISSRMEGGANVVSEAIRIGVPVLASRIAGNVGLLGRAYPAYYPVGDGPALARLMLRAARDARFYASLKRRIAALRPMVAPESEARMLRAAIGAALPR
jgi:putative glycosyltransferase (TIGR04348 family)